MATKNPLANINPKTMGFGKSGTHPFHTSTPYDNRTGSKVPVNRVTNPAYRTAATANLSKENLGEIMNIIGGIVGNKADRYSGLNRQDEMKFRHELEQSRQHGKLTREDIKDAWEIWKNFDK